MKRVGILYHPKLSEALALAYELKKFLTERNVPSWVCSAWNEAEAKPQISGSDLILSIGGDGTILRTARIIIPASVPILGINLGKLGFMTEFNSNEAFDKLPSILAGEGWIEVRAMLEAQIPQKEDKSFHALNDVVVGRGALNRLVHVETRINDDFLTTYRADGVIIATATGSTGYSLACGGPILDPQARELLLQPISPHLSLSQAIILPPSAQIELKVITSHQAMLVIDGQVELPLESGTGVKVKLSPYVTRFLKTRPTGYFYRSLELKLRRGKD